MLESYENFIARVKVMKQGELIEKGESLDAIYFLQKALSSSELSYRLEVISEDGSTMGKKLLAVYKAV